MAQFLDGESEVGVGKRLVAEREVPPLRVKGLEAGAYMILEIVREIAECFNIEDEQILDMLVNRSDKLSHFIEIYQLKLAS